MKTPVHKRKTAANMKNDNTVSQENPSHKLREIRIHENNCSA